MKSKHADFPKSQLQQFNFQSAEETTLAAKSEETESEKESLEQQEQKQADDAEVEGEEESEEEEEEKEPPVMTPNRKGKEKILIDEKSETKEEEDIDATSEEAIKRATRIKEAKRSLKEIIASITTKQPATTTFSPATTKKTPTKSLVSTPGPSNKRKWAQPF